MDILEYAMQIEKEGEAHYRKLAERSNNPGMKKILTELADSEVEHYNVFKAIKENSNIPEIDEAILPNVKDIFSKMQTDKMSDTTGDEVELYRKAKFHEKENQKFYQQKAEEADEPALKEMLLKIAQEEAKHEQVLEGIIDFIASPTQWLENAEWHRIDTY